MASTRRVRVVLRIPPQLAVKYERLGQQFGYTRSELYRLALDHAYPAMAKWCERGTGALDGATGDLLGSSDSASASASSLTPLGRLSALAGTLVSTDPVPDLARVRAQLFAKADSLGLSRMQSEPYVDVLVAEVARSSQRAAAKSARSGQRPRSRAGAAPLLPTSSPTADDDSDSDLDPSSLSTVPELD